MTEFKVWRAIVDWVEDHGGVVFAACPPGSSVYDYIKFCLIDPKTKKRDEPDILFSLNDDLYIVECKPTLKASISRGIKMNSNESDVDKLLRVLDNCKSGNYDEQLQKNYGIDMKQYNVKIAIGYAGRLDKVPVMNNGVINIVVQNSKEIKIVG